MTRSARLFAKVIGAVKRVRAQSDPLVHGVLVFICSFNATSVPLKSMFSADRPHASSCATIRRRRHARISETAT